MGGGAEEGREDNCRSLGAVAAIQYGPSLYSESTPLLCQRGTREALNVTFRDAQRFSPEAKREGEKNQ